MRGVLKSFQLCREKENLQDYNGRRPTEPDITKEVFYG